MLPGSSHPGRPPQIRSTAARALAIRPGKCCPRLGDWAGALGFSEKNWGCSKIRNLSLIVPN